MDYSVGQCGRVVVMRLHDGDPIYASIENVAKKENITHAAVWIVGGMQNAGVVVGPKKQNSFPLETMVEQFVDAREVVGFGTVFANADGEPKLHLHAAIGKGQTVIAGCPRKGADCWLVDEVIMLEITGVSAQRLKEDPSGLDLLTINSYTKPQS